MPPILPASPPCRRDSNFGARHPFTLTWRSGERSRKPRGHGCVRRCLCAERRPEAASPRDAGK
jgi:hypothetical protein